MNKYIKILSDIYKDYHNSKLDKSIQLSESISNFIIWIVGLSLGALTLIITAFEKNSNFSELKLSNLILFFLITIISGVLGKSLNTVSNYLGFHLNSLFSFNLRMTRVPIKPRNLNRDVGAKDIYKYLKDDFNEEYPHILHGLDNLT